MNIKKILIADDHSLVRDGLKQLILSVCPETEIMESSNCRQAIDITLCEPDIDVVLFDLTMPDMDGFVALTALTDNQGAIPIIVISASENPRDMQRALDIGAMGFIPKSESNEVILSAIQLIMSGGIYIPSAMARAHTRNSRLTDNLQCSLTERQQEVLRCVMKGLSNKEIARELGLAEITVKTHVSAILKSLDVNTRTQAVLAAKKLGYGD